MKRPAFGGRVELTLAFPAGICIATMRRSAPAMSGKNVAPEIVTVEVDLPPEMPCEMVALPDRKASLEGARLVVCGGRGLDASSFENLDEIAGALGGVVGGSLPAVDAGLAPVSHQVGQSGKFVTPKLTSALACPARCNISRALAQRRRSLRSTMIPMPRSSATPNLALWRTRANFCPCLLPS